MRDRLMQFIDGRRQVARVVATGVLACGGVLIFLMRNGPGPDIVRIERHQFALFCVTFCFVAARWFWLETRDR